MKQFLASLLVTLLAAFFLTRVEGPPGDQSLVFANGTVIDGTGAPPRPNMALVIRGDRITAVVLRGKLLSRSSLDAMLACVQTAAGKP